MPTLRVFDPDGGRRDHVFEDDVEIGRSPTAAVRLPDREVSRCHAAIERRGADYVLCDRGSRLGVVVDGRRIDRHVLRDGDRFGVARWEFCFLAEPRAEPALDALLEKLAAARLPRPPIPPALEPALRRFDAWWFGTRRTDGLYQYAPVLLAEADRADVPDYVIVGHAGHGVNSYALHYFLRVGPLLALFELSFGGAYTEPTRARADIAEAFAAAETLIAAVPALVRRDVPPAGLQVMISTVRRSSWQAGAARGSGQWSPVLAAAVAWAAGEEPFVAVGQAAARAPAAERGVSKARRPEAGLPRLSYREPGIGQRRELAIGPELVIGCHPGADLRLEHPSVSSRHCRLFVRDGARWVEDLGSARGTAVDGRTLDVPTPIVDGARLRVGDIELVYCERGRPTAPD